MALSFQLWGDELGFRFVAEINQTTALSFTQTNFKLQAIAGNAHPL